MEAVSAKKGYSGILWLEFAAVSLVAVLSRTHRVQVVSLTLAKM